MFLEKPSHTSPVTLYLAELLSLFDQQADLLLPTCIDGFNFKSMKLQVLSPILINLKKICQYNDDNMVQLQTLSVYSGIGLELPSSELELNCLRDFVPQSELNWN